MVFVLSATGDIKRYINSFDLAWLEKHCHYLPIDEFDRQIVSELKQKKESSRNYEVNLCIANGLSKSHLLNVAISNLEKDRFFQKNDLELATDISTSHRKNALSIFLESLRWITTKSQNQAHLVFLNSFTYIEKFLQVGSNQVPASFYEDIKAGFEVLKQNEGREYFIQIDGKPCQVVFFDAAKGREMDDKDFRQIEENTPIVVVTTYPTASNGVNLKWITKETDSRTDFTGIHLLEAPHYYFSGRENEFEEVDKEKMFIWQMWKLYSNHQISESNFMTAVQELNIQMMNQQYKNLPDYLLNQISVFYQAIGRVDRQWNLMPKMDVRLASGSSGVIEIFEQYLTAQGSIAKSRLEREDYTSSLILEINRQIEKLHLRKKVLNELQFEELSKLNSRCEEKIDHLLQSLVDLRNGEYNSEDSQQMMFLWWKIREAMLKQDYHFSNRVELSNQVTRQKIVHDIDFMRDFAYCTAFLQNDHELYIDPVLQRVLPHHTETTKTYDLNRFYRNYSQNKIIDWYFQTHNYKLGYQSVSNNPIFIPIALQTILAGAIGEVALKAILDHNNIPLVFDSEFPPNLFEVSDMQIQGLPIYIDAKNYSSWTTLYRFSAKPGDPEFDEKMNSKTFLTAAYKKWHYVVKQTGNKEAKLVFINLLAGDEHPNEGWDAELKPIRPFSFSKSIITVIQGAFYQENPDSLRDEFISWVNYIKAQLKQ